MLSVIAMFCSVTLPQLLTTPLTVLAEPISTVSQFFVTRMQGLSVTTHVAVAVAETWPPHRPVPVAVTVFGKLPQVLLFTCLLYACEAPGANEATVVI